MEAALHPDAFGQILNRIWRLMRAHFRLFLAISAVPACTMLVLYAVVIAMAFATAQYVHPPINALAWTVIAADCVAGLACLAAWFFAYALYEPAVSYAALQLDAGRSVTFREAYGVAWSKAGRYLWLLILRRVVVGGPMILPVLIFALGWLGSMVHPRQAPPVLSVFSVLAMFLAGLLYLAASAWALLASIRLVLAQPACLVENLAAWDAIRRSNQLSKGGRLRIFLVALVLYAVSYGAMLACELAFGILVGLGAIPVLLLHLGPPWWITGIVLLGICFASVLVLLVMEVSSSYSVAFAILYREQVRLQAMAAPGETG